MLSCHKVVFISASFVILFISCADAEALANCWAQQSNINENDFVLECTEDGNFKPLQCDKKTGYCFCVNEHTGKPNFGSMARPINHMLDCNKQASSSSGRERNYRRRRPKESPKSRGSRGDRCNPSQRISQINFLISSFKMEQDIVTNQQTKVSKVTTSAPSRATDWSHPIIGIRRTRQSSPYPSSSLAASSPVEWKFGRLDKDGSYRLSSEEFLPLVDLSREKMKSLIGCANSLLLYCDTNKDSSVDSGEFSYCFNTANAVQLQNLLKNARMKNPRKDTKFQQPQPLPMMTQAKQHSYPSAMAPPPPPPPPTSATIVQMPSTASSSSSSPISYSSILLQNPVNSQQQKGNSTQSRLDCNATRDNLMETAALSGTGQQRQRQRTGTFIPKCTADGYYEQVQCMPDLQFCWCVNRVTGQTIKSIKTNSSQTPSLTSCEGIRQGKGCDQRRRVKFHNELRLLLLRENLSCDLVFPHIDTSRDLAISAAEWKTFKKARRQTINSRLRKCFRTEVAYCDQNGDQMISHSEWLKCCNNKLNHSFTESPPAGTGSGSSSGPSLMRGSMGAAREQQSVPINRNTPLLPSGDRMKTKPKGKNPFTGILRP